MCGGCFSLLLRIVMVFYVSRLVDKWLNHEEDRIYLQIFNLASQQGFQDDHYKFNNLNMALFVHLTQFDKDGVR